MKKEKIPVKTLKFKCSECGKTFKINIPIDNTIIKLKSKNGKEAWIKTYGKGGYLEITSRLIPEEDSISMQIFKRIKSQIENLIEKDLDGDAYEISSTIAKICANCGSSKIYEKEESIEFIDALFLENLI